MEVLSCAHLALQRLLDHLGTGYIDTKFTSSIYRGARTIYIFIV